MNSENNSRRQSRRDSISHINKILSTPGTHAEMGNAYNKKAMAKDFLEKVYESSSSKHAVEDLENKRKELQTKQEEVAFAHKMIEQMRNESKNMRREMDIMTRIIDEMRANGNKFDLGAILGRKNENKATETSSDNPEVFGAEYKELVDKVKDLEYQLMRRQLDDKVNPRGGALSEDEGEGSLYAKDLDLKLKE